MYRVILCIFVLLVVSCQGYQYSRVKNPFSDYGVKKIYIKQFYNKTNINNISHPFTKSFINEFSQFPGLKIVSDKKNADAILFGELISEKSRNETIQITDTISAKNSYESQLGGNRKDFYVPYKRAIGIELHVKVLSKANDLIYEDKTKLNHSFDYIVTAQRSQIMKTQNAGVLRLAISQMAKSHAQSFKEKILYAF